MLSRFTSSTRASRDSSTGSMNGNIMQKIKTRLFEFLSSLLDKEVKGLRVILFILELIGMIEYLLITLQHCFHWIPSVDQVISYILVLIVPSHLTSNITSFTVTFIIIALFVLVILLASLYFFYFGNDNEFVCVLLFLGIRVLRTCIIFPALDVMFSPLLCNYLDGTFKWNLFEDQNYICIEFPFLIFYIVGLCIGIIIILISSLDILLINDRLRGINYFTASSDGRFLFVMFVFQISNILASEILGSINEIQVWISLTFFILYLGVYCVYWRVLPFYNKMFSYIYCLNITLLISLFLTSFIIDVYEDFRAFSAFTSLLIFPPIGIVLLIVRYRLIYGYFKDKIKNNWLCSSPHDVGIISYLTDKKKSSVFKILKDTKFQKSRRICHILIGVYLKIDISFANQIYLHQENMFDKEFFDTKFFLFLFKRSINDLQMIGTKGISKVIKSLRKIKSRETRMNKLFQQFLGKMLNEVVDRSEFPTILSSIQEAIVYCEKNYQKLIRLYPSETVYRRYGGFLSKYRNDKVNADIFFNEAAILDDPDDTLSEKSYDENIDRLDKIPSSDRKKSLKRIRSYESEKGKCLSVRSKRYAKSGIKTLSVNSKGGTGTNSNYSSYQLISNYMTKAKFFSVNMVTYGLVLLFFVSVSVIISTYFILLSLNTELSRSTEVIELSSSIRSDVVNILYYTRKYQISTYDSDETPLELLQNSTLYRSQLEETCLGLSHKIKEIYTHMETSHREIWREVIILKDVDEVDGHKTSLYDGVMLYLAKCSSLLSYSEEDYSNRTKPIELSEPFVFVEDNEKILFPHLQSMLEDNIVIEREDAQKLNILLVVCSAIIGSFLIFIGLTYLFLLCQQKISYKGLRLLPREEIVTLYEKFGGNVENNEERHVRTHSTSPVQKFCLTSCIFFILFLCVILFFTIFSSIAAFKFAERNYKYDYATRINVLCRRMNYYILEVLYREDSRIDDEDVISSLEEGKIELERLFEDLKYGNGKYKGIDEDPTSRNIMYIDDCDPDQQSNDADVISCLSLNRMMLYYIESIENLFAVLLVNGTFITDLNVRESSEVLKIIYLNEGNGNFSGRITEKVSKMSDIIENSVSSYLWVVNNGSVLLLVFFLPFFILMFLFVFYSYPSLLNNYLMMVKHVLLMLPSSVLLRKQIYDYIVGKGNYLKVAAIDKDFHQNEFVSIMKMSSQCVIVFDKSLRTISYNNSAASLFNLKTVKGGSLRLFLNDESIQKIVNWMKSPIGKPFTKEIVSSCNGVEFSLVADISRNKDKFIGLFEDVDSAKKKKILEEAEKRSAKTDLLLRNILPKDIAKVMKLDEKNTIINVHKQVSAIFCDLTNFTKWSSTQDPEYFVSILNELFSGIDDLCDEYNVEKIKTIGDSYFGVVGVPNYLPNHAEYAMNFCIRVLEYLKVFNLEKSLDMHMRIGISSGSVVAGVIGKKKWCYDVWGPTINTASRMESTGIQDKIQVSRETYEYIFDKFAFLERDMNIQGVGLIKTYIYSLELHKIQDGSLSEEDETEENEIRQIEEINQKVNQGFAIQDESVDHDNKVNSTDSFIEVEDSVKVKKKDKMTKAEPVCEYVKKIN